MLSPSTTLNLQTHHIFLKGALLYFIPLWGHGHDLPTDTIPSNSLSGTLIAHFNQLSRIDSLGGQGVLPPLVAAAVLAPAFDADEHPVGADVALVPAEAGLALAGARLAVARRAHRALPC